MEKLNCNGYIVQRKNISEYMGVDGDNWYLNYCNDNPYFEQFYNNNIAKSWENSKYVDCCIDEMYIKKYIDKSKQLNIPFRVLLCYTNKNNPILENFILSKKSIILGYDYAYLGGSYYSCILNDIISKRIEEFNNIKLNKYGLFNSYKEVKSFIEYRTKLEKEKKYDFELGDFIIYKIKEIIYN